MVTSTNYYAAFPCLVALLICYWMGSVHTSQHGGDSCWEVIPATVKAALWDSLTLIGFESAPGEGGVRLSVCNCVFPLKGGEAPGIQYLGHCVGEYWR